MILIWKATKCIWRPRYSRVALTGRLIYLGKICSFNAIIRLPIFTCSLGLIILELSANIELPSQGDSWRSLRTGVFDEIHFDSDISEDLIHLIFAMLHPDPYQRPSMHDIINMAHSYAPQIHEISRNISREPSPFFDT
jgi:hypothetical protein